jgi:hypothetical protein
MHDAPQTTPELTLSEVVEELRRITREHDVKLPPVEDFLREERNND